MFIKAGQVEPEQERRGSVSNWFSSLRRGAGRRKREEVTVPSGYGSLGRRKDGTQPRGKTRSAWDLTTVSRLVCILNIYLYCTMRCKAVYQVWRKSKCSGSMTLAISVSNEDRI